MTFEVEKKWKGSLNKYVTIYEGGTSCHLEFNNYDKYIVFAYQSPIYAGWEGAPKIEGLTSDICNRTQPDPDKYPRYVDVDSIDEEQPFNDKADLDKIFTSPIRLIDFDQLYKVVAVLGMLIILMIIIKKRLITPHTNNN